MKDTIIWRVVFKLSENLRNEDDNKNASGKEQQTYLLNIKVAGWNVPS
mgnify:CR=1 FL=1